MVRIIFLVLVFFCSFVFSKDLAVTLIVDKSSQKYLDDIKKEVLKLFSSDDHLNYNIKVCSNCENLFSNRAIFLLKNSSKFPESKNSYIVSYNFISSAYDENRVVRASALAIFEYLVENKIKSIYIRNESLISKKENEKNFKKLALKDILEYALSNNIKIKMNKNSLKLKDLKIDKAKTFYKPKLEVFSNYIQIDKDRARISRGTNPEKTVEAGMKLSQLIYSNKVLKNIEISKLLKKATGQEIKALDDEILYKASLMYLNIIKVKKYIDIISIKKDFVKKNLLFSKQRVEIGIKDRSDLYRWQSELANVNIKLSNTKKELEILKTELFNLLRIENNYDFIDCNLDSKEFKLLDKNAIIYIRNKKIQDNFINQIVHIHPRLRQIKELIRAKNKELKLHRGSYYLPTLALEGNAKRILKRDGVASDLPRVWDDKEYQAVLNLSLPLYEGGSKSVDIQKNEIEIINLKLKYNDTKNLIVENVQKNYDSLLKSYEKIGYSEESLNSSKKSFELIEDKYRNGEENIISLLDAQDNYIVSKLNLNISNIEYLIDLTSIYFFSGNIDILFNEIKKEEMERKINKILKENN